MPEQTSNTGGCPLGHGGNTQQSRGADTATGFVQPTKTLIFNFTPWA